jgi:hypothetical protein
MPTMRAPKAVLCLVAATVAACASMQSQYNVRRSNLTCDQANRYAFQSLKSLGYDVTSFQPAALGRPGELRGTKSEAQGSRSSTHDGVVHIVCDASEVRLDAAEEQFLSQDLTFTRGFYLAFTGIADHAASGAAYAEEQSGGATSGGVKFKIQPQLALETKLDFGEDLAAGGVLAVKVTVQNGSAETYKLDVDAIELRPREGTNRVTQMDVATAARAIAKATAADLGPSIPGPSPATIESTLRERALKGRTLKPGDSAEGFVYFPVGSYARARATLVDVATGESEGFLVEF